jgi:hypothetical protein
MGRNFSMGSFEWLRLKRMKQKHGPCINSVIRITDGIHLVTLFVLADRWTHEIMKAVRHTRGKRHQLPPRPHAILPY